MMIGRSMIIFICVLVSFIPAFVSAEPDPKPQNISIEFQFLRILSTLSGDTALDEDLWVGGKRPDNQLANTLTFFTSGHFQAGENRLEVGASGWSWDGKPISFPLGKDMEIPMPENRARLFQGPSVVVQSGEKPSCEIQSNRDLEYMDKRADGLFELKKLPNPTDLVIEMKPEVTSNGRIHLSEMNIALSLIEKREPVAGTNLLVGRPILQERKFNADISVTPGKDYGLLLHPKDGQGILIIRLRASLK